jgi:ATP-dependent RNA helicase RhlB
MPVQEQVLTNAFGGQDLYVQSQTGTGKTAAFLIVVFQRLLTESSLSGKKVLIMTPTRELAVQVEEEARLLGKYLPFKTGSFYGGVGYSDQQRLLKNQVQILVGTPGRVLDLNASGKMNLMDIAFLVLDEADRMFDMGFYPDLRKLIKVIPPADRRQTMLFSATLNNWVKNLALEYTKSPREIEIAPENVTVEEIEQVLYHVPSEDKMKLLIGILEREKPESAIIFCNTKRYVEIVAKRLQLNEIACEFIIGDLPQSRRLKIINDVKAGKIRFLVATDVAARGLDIEALAMVVNYDLPGEEENYVHRIGRTARAGKTGKAVTLASEQDVYELPAIERYLGKKIPSEIATAELFGEDKSAGMRIKTETYDGERNSSRDRNGGRSGGEARRRSGRNREHSSSRSAENASVRTERRASRQRRGKNGPEPDISTLPFEERMAYYKQKYDTTANPAGAGDAPVKQKAEGPDEHGNRGREKSPGGSSRKRRDAGKRTAGKPPLERGKNSGSPRQRGGTSGGGSKPPVESLPSGAAEQENKKTGTGQPAVRTGAAQNQSLLNRLLGIFKPKKQKE